MSSVAKLNFPKIVKLNMPVRIQISMGNSLCSGEPIRETVDWLIACGAPKIIFQISDLLHRHNLIWMRRTSMSRASRMASELGDTWLANNIASIRAAQKSISSVVIERWAALLSGPEFDEALKGINCIYRGDLLFRENVNREVRSYFNKTRRSICDERFMHSVNYMLEEIAVTESCARLDTTIEVYPGDRFKPEEYLACSPAYELALGHLHFVNLVADDGKLVKASNRFLEPA